MPFPRVDKLTNALAEIGLILASILFGVLGLPIWVIAVMVVLSSLWWGGVHYVRLSTMLRSGTLGALGTMAIALAAIALGHTIGYGFGSIFHTILGLK